VTLTKAAAAVHRGDDEGGRGLETAGRAIEVQGDSRSPAKIEVRLELRGHNQFAADVVRAVADVLRADTRFPKLSRFEIDVLFGDVEREIERAVEEGIQREIGEALEEEEFAREREERRVSRQNIEKEKRNAYANKS
jgi:hypothetical protein